MKTNTMKKLTTYVATGLALCAGGAAHAGMLDGLLGSVGDALTPNTRTETKTGSLNIVLPPYDGPKHTICVGEFRASSGCRMPHDLNFQTRLQTALASCGRFKVVNRTTLQSVLREQGLGASGAANANPGTVQQGRLRQAAFIAEGMITSVSYDTGDSRSGIKVKGLDIRTGSQSARVAITLNVSDSTSSDIVASTEIVGEAKSSNFGIGLHGSGNGGGVGGRSRTPLDDAFDACISNAVVYIAAQLQGVTSYAEGRKVPVVVAKVYQDRKMVGIKPGARAGVAVGQEVQFAGPKDELGFATGETSVLKVVAVNEEFAQCELISGSLPPSDAKSEVVVQ